MDDLHYISAADALEAFRTRELSPVEVAEALIARAEATEPALNTMMGRYFEQAIGSAREAERRWADGTARPLEGLLIAVKDENEIEGQPMTNGSMLLADNIADHTEIGVRRILDAGAIVHARTTTPEFSSASACISDLHGVTRNPWNTQVTPGGSSGGSAASVAAGSSTMASGSDIGGSIRIPASMCGVAGYKPPHGRVPIDNEWTYELYTHDHGPIARSVRDAVLYENVIAGPSPLDPFSLPATEPLSTEPYDLKGLRIGFSMDLGYKPVDPDVRREVLAAVARLEEAGAIVDEVDLGWDGRIDEAMMAHFATGMDLKMRMTFGDEALREKASKVVLWNMDQAPDAGAEDAVREQVTRYEMSQDLARIHADHDILLVPTVASTRIPAEFDPWTMNLDVDGRELADPILDWTMTVAFNMLSSCPVWSVPAGLADNGVPIGLQFVAPPYRDEVATGIALAWDQIRPDIGRPNL